MGKGGWGNAKNGPRDGFVPPGTNGKKGGNYPHSNNGILLPGSDHFTDLTPDSGSQSARGPGGGGYYGHDPEQHAGSTHTPGGPGQEGRKERRERRKHAQ